MSCKDTLVDGGRLVYLPPFSQRVNGSFAGSFRDSKNQKNTWTCRKLDTHSTLISQCDNTYIRRQIHITRVTLHPRRGLANTRVLVPDRDIIRCGGRLVIMDLLRQVQMIAPLVPLLRRETRSP
jgi:hypothetical protein